MKTAPTIAVFIELNPGENDGISPSLTTCHFTTNDFSNNIYLQLSLTVHFEHPFPSYDLKALVRA